MSLNFEYCECGCHGSESDRIGETTYWIGCETSKGKVNLHRGHGWTSPMIAECDTYEEAVELATGLARILLVEEDAHLALIRKQLGPKPKEKKLPTFRQELIAQFPGKDNAMLRRLINDCNSARNILKFSGAMAFTDDARKKLALVAAAFDRG